MNLNEINNWINSTQIFEKLIKMILKIYLSELYSYAFLFFNYLISPNTKLF